jgi:prepilin-type N-terminal cleavage/methylation domain-containing protein
MRTTNAPRRGMTLMELIVGIAITGLMAAMGTATFGSIIDHRRVVLASTGELERASALRDQLRSWLASGTVQILTGGVPRGIGGQTGAVSGFAPPPAMPGSSSSGATISSAVAAGDEVVFVTTAPNPANTPSVRMRLFVDGDDTTPETGLTLEYQASTATPLVRVELERSIGVLKVEFLDQRTNQWVESTQAAAIQPIAVRISMAAYEGGRIPGILQVPLVFAMGTLATGQ